MRNAQTAAPISRLEWLAAGCLAATVSVWAFIDLGTETQLQWLTETALLPVVGLVIPLAGLITGSIAVLGGRGLGARSRWARPLRWSRSEDSSSAWRSL